MRKMMRRCDEAAQLVLAQADIICLYLTQRRAEVSVCLEKHLLIACLRRLRTFGHELMLFLDGHQKSEVDTEIRAYCHFRLPALFRVCARLTREIDDTHAKNQLAALIAYAPAKAAEQSQAATIADERTFILAHQVIECWLIAAIHGVQEAIDQLGDAQNTQAAIGFIRLSTAIVHFLRQAIHFPESISSADYLLFRPKLSGSGVESVAIRRFEILLGTRNAHYLVDLNALHLLTPLLEQQYQRSSLYDSFLRLLVTHGIIPTATSPSGKAISVLIKPTMVNDDKHRGLTELLYALLKLSQEMKLWQADHLSMAELMIGHRPTLGIGDLDKTTPNLGGLPYLRRVLARSPLFPELWEAISYAGH